MKEMLSMLKDMKQMQAKMKEVQKQLELKEVEGSAGRGHVVIKANGNWHVNKVQIHPDAMNDKDKLEIFIQTAINDALKQIGAVQQKEMKQASGLTQSVMSKIPGLGKFL